MTSLRMWFANRLAGRRPVRPFRPTFEPLEARQLLSGTPVTPPPDLHDPVIAPVAQAEFTQDNGSLSRADVIHILNVVDGTETPVFSNGQVSFTPATPSPHATVTASQLTDLHTLVRDAGAWGLAPDVANLAGKVVDQNPANENYQGSPLLRSGQLAPGARDTVVQDLVGKWFYGTDLPATAAAAANNGIPDTVVYQTAKGKLFGSNGPSVNDVAQGWVGDCYFMSALGETAQQSPGTIKDMFVNNGDGTYTVRFFERDAANNTWHADYVTVNLELPVLQQSGRFAFAGWYQGGKPVTSADPNAVLWPALAEKAYAQLAEEGWSRAQSASGSGIGSTPSDWNQNSYDALAAGDGVAVQQIGGSSHTYDVGLAGATSKDASALEEAFEHGSLVTFGSLGTEPAGVPTNAAGAPLIIPGHVYMLKATDDDGDTFTLVNPYNDSSLYPGDGQRTVTLSWSQLRTYFNDYFVVAPPPICPAHAVVQQGQNTGDNGGAKAENVQWYDNGVAIASPKDAHEGDAITVTFDTAADSKKTEFSLVAYACPNGNVNSWNIDHQQEWADTTATFTGGTHHSLTVTLPNGYFQIDFVYGNAITNFGSGERYSEEGRLIAGGVGGDHVVRCDC